MIRTVCFTVEKDNLTFGFTSTKDMNNNSHNITLEQTKATEKKRLTGKAKKAN